MQSGDRLFSANSYRFIADEPNFVVDSKELEQMNPEIPGNTVIFGPNFMAQRLYQLSPPEDLTPALLVIRPANRFNIDSLIKENSMVP